LCSKQRYPLAAPLLAHPPYNPNGVIFTRSAASALTAAYPPDSFRASGLPLTEHMGQEPPLALQKRSEDPALQAHALQQEAARTVDVADWVSIPAIGYRRSRALDRPMPRRRNGYMTTRRIAAPWRAEKVSSGHVVQDANGQALGYDRRKRSRRAPREGSD